jgi:hypothetical protein
VKVQGFLFGVSNITNPFKNFNVGPVRPIDFSIIFWNKKILKKMTKIENIIEK